MACASYQNFTFSLNPLIFALICNACAGFYISSLAGTLLSLVCRRDGRTLQENNIFF